MRNFISVVIPTYNNKFLNKTLESLKCQRWPSNLFEVIVVENPIKTDKVYNLCKTKNFKHIVSQLGSNRARNLGISRSKGKIIALCDDDIVVDKYWLANINYKFNNLPELGVCGGKVELEFVEEKPKWITGPFYHYLSEVNDIASSVWFNEDDVNTHIVSANCCFLKERWLQVGGFDENIGYHGSNMIPNDEVEFFQKLSRLGSPHYVYEGDIEAKHIIDKDRTNLDWFRRRFYGQGVADAQLLMRKNPSTRINDLYHDSSYNQEIMNLSNVEQINKARNTICDEHTTRLHIKNIIICKTDYIMGFQNTLCGEMWQRIH